MKLFKFLCCPSPDEKNIIDVSLPIHNVLKVWIHVFIEDDIVFEESTEKGGIAWGHLRAHARARDLEIFVVQSLKFQANCVVLCPPWLHVCRSQCHLLLGVCRVT